MWKRDVGWKWDLFAHLLPPLVIKNIAALKLVDDPQVGDLFYWKGSTKGGFSIKYALTIMRDESKVPSSPKWDLVWSTQRFRVFL